MNSWKRIFDKESKLQNEKHQFKYYCKCGHSVYIMRDEDKKLCSWCNHYVFRNKREEFGFRLVSNLKKVR